MNKYLPLAIERYQHNYDPNFSVEDEYEKRLTSPASVVTKLFPLLTYQKRGGQTKEFPIFFTYTADLVALASQLERNSRQISQLAGQLPGVAQAHFLNSLLLDEITYTNEIEGIKTDAAEISTIINSLDDGLRAREKRLWSTVRMYQEASRGKLLSITALQDFRDIYDELLKGEIPPEKKPNGQLFRDTLPDGQTSRIGNATKTVHVPPTSELAISEALMSLIAFMNDDDLPAVYKALITHFFFENTHPFLDGNGRMGRYLLSTYLSAKFDKFTGFSVATAIHAQASRYYKLFKEADVAENRAELTFFIKDMLEILVAQQEQVLEALQGSRQRLDFVFEKVDQEAAHLAENGEHDQATIRAILRYLAESALFVNNDRLGIKDNDIIKLNSEDGISQRRTKRSLAYLEEIGAISLVSGRPKLHKLVR